MAFDGPLLRSLRIRTLYPEQAGASRIRSLSAQVHAARKCEHAEHFDELGRLEKCRKRSSVTLVASLAHTE